MDADRVVIDISSDEENCADDSFGIPDEWINELLEHVDIEVQGDFNDVKVLDELSVPSCAEKPSPLEKDSDDDCLVLDGDPDMLIPMVDVKHNPLDGLDDLIIVGEKGHLACRDYPHPRHLCLNFPFDSTPHKKYCKLCHCYVCDSPAPCIYWGRGFLAKDHCNSNEKEKRWKDLRNLNLGITNPPEPEYSVCSPIFSSSQGIGNPTRYSQNSNRHSITAPTAAIPDPSVQRGHRPPNSSTSVRHRPVNPGTLHRVGTQPYPRGHTSVRTVTAPTYSGSTNDKSSSFSSQGRPVSKQVRQTAAPRFHSSSVLQGPHRKPLDPAHANTQSIQPEASSNMNMLRGILASIEADLLGTDNNSGSIEDNNMPLVSSHFPAP